MFVIQRNSGCLRLWSWVRQRSRNPAINRFLRIWTSAALFSIHYISNIYDWFCQISPKYAANDVELSLKSLYFADQVERIYRLPSTIEPWTKPFPVACLPEDCGEGLRRQMCFAMVIQNGGAMPGAHPRRSTFSAPATKQNGGNPLFWTFAGIFPHEPSWLSNSVALPSSARLPLSSRPSLSSKIPTPSLGLHPTQNEDKWQAPNAFKLLMLWAAPRAWWGISEDIHASRQEQILIFIASIPVRSEVRWRVCLFCGRGGAGR